jgi:hypothetical protein
MAFVMAIGNEVSGECVEGINVVVEVQKEEAWLCCGWKYLRFIWEAKAAQNLRRRSVMVPGIGCCFGAFGDV